MANEGRSPDKPLYVTSVDAPGPAPTIGVVDQGAPNAGGAEAWPVVDEVVKGAVDAVASTLGSPAQAGEAASATTDLATEATLQAVRSGTDNIPASPATTGGQAAIITALGSPAQAGEAAAAAAGKATDATLAALNVSLEARLNTLGQKASLASAPVVLSTEQEAIVLKAQQVDANNSKFIQAADASPGAPWVGTASPTRSRGVIGVFLNCISPGQVIAGTYTFEFGEDGLTWPISIALHSSDFSTIRFRKLLNVGAYFRAQFEPDAPLGAGFVVLTSQFAFQAEPDFVVPAGHIFEEEEAAFSNIFAFGKAFKANGQSVNIRATENEDLRVGFQAVPDANNSVAAAPLAAYLGTPFIDENALSAYFGAPPPPAPADTWIAPLWTPVKDFAAFSLDAFHSGLGQGYAIWSTDGVNISRIETTAFGGAGAFTDPPQGSKYFRIALQNRSAAPTVFVLHTLMRYGQQGLFMFPAAAPIDGSFPAALVKNIGTGRQPDADYADQRTPGSVPEFSTQTPLGVAATFAPVITPGIGSGRDPLQTGPGYDGTGFVSVYVIVNASSPSATNGLKIEFSNDKFATINQEFLFTYTAAMVGNGRRFLVPANAGEQFRVRYVNGGTAQTAFDLRTELSTTQVQAMSDDIGRGSLLISPGLRISQVLGRTPNTVVGLDLTADATLYTVPAGKIFYVTSIEWGGENTSTTTSMKCRLRDGGAAGTVQSVFLINESIGGLGGVNETSNDFSAYQEPIPFTVNVFFDAVTGAPVVDVILVGYLEDS